MIFAGGVTAQSDETCREFGLRPTLDEPGVRVSYVYGLVVLKGYDPSTKFPRVTINFMDAQRSQGRVTINRSGNYCFRSGNSGGGTLIVEVDGVEVSRRSVANLALRQQREDFEIDLIKTLGRVAPGVISAKFVRPQNEKTVNLYKKTVEAESDGDTQKALKLLNEIVAIDPADFVAWAKLGSTYFGQNSLAEAEAAFLKALELRPDYTPALLNFGTLRAVRKEFEAAIELFKQAIGGDPLSARGYRLLGEAYLQVRKGSLGVEALNQAIKLDPVGMAECHLLLARLYDLAGAKHLASREYKLFLAKVKDHPDKKKFERYIKDNPEQTDGE